ncbi:MAG: sigma 54-dependent Fis family transcriptional regulator [Myxococcales bacterium]|nr:sigma 54-dependent Fis family transcriptional regulator [Myxococcales bacterium]
MGAVTATIHTATLPGVTASPRCQVVVIDGPDRGQAAPLSLPDGVVTVGTGEGATLRLTDERVSRRHLTITAEAGRFRVVDHESTNGTRYEGSELGDLRVPLGATLKLGRSFLRIVPVARALRVRPSSATRCGELVGESLAMREAFAVIDLAAESDVTVLLEGETGTGKELAARAIHERSARRLKPFVTIDCGALPEALLESELFGHVKGAFTGAHGARAGAFVRAHGGTLFLDELGGVSAAVQARLLRAVEARAVRPVGADSERAVDVRIVAASRHDLVAQVADGRFRSDLYYRLSVLRVGLAPLRQRREDLAIMVTEMMRRRGLEAGPIEGAGYELLLSHDWPGNGRELRNVIDRAMALCPTAQRFTALNLSLDGAASADDPWPAVHPGLAWEASKSLVLHAFERKYLTALWAESGHNLSAAARRAALDRKHLRALLRRHGLVGAEGSE